MDELMSKQSINESKEIAIAEAMETSEGRVSLAQAMVDPIKIALEYQAIGRKVLMVDELPQGALPRYERDIAAVSYVVPKRGSVPDVMIEAEELLVPTFEIACNPTVRLNEIRARRYYIVDRAQVKAKDAIQRQEDLEVFKAISVSVSTDNTVTVAGNLTPDNVNMALALIEQRELIGAKILVHPFRYKDIRAWGKDFFDEATQRDVIMSGLYGHVWTADIHVSTMVPKNSVYVLAPPEFVGAMPVRQDITVLPADDPKTLRLGWVVYEEIGVAVINDYACAKIVLG
jgi:hypothetical protein